MNLTVLGGVGEHGRACFLVENEGLSILLDCGGKKFGAERFPNLDRSVVSRLDAVFISHIHEDHSAGLRLLYALGYKNKIYSSELTAHYLRKKYQFPVEQYEYLEKLGPTTSWFHLLPKLRLIWGRSGHALGAVWFLLDLNGEKVFYTGDYTPFSPLAKNDNILTSDILTTTQIDLAIFDVAHGSQHHTWSFCWRNILTLIKKKLADDGKIMLPVPALGRAQDLLILLSRSFPKVMITVEDTIYKWLQANLQNKECFSPKGLYRLKQTSCRNIAIISDRRQFDKRLDTGRIFLVGDSTLDSPIAAYWFRTLSQDPRNTLIFTGHIEEGTFAHKLMTNKSPEIKMDVYHYRYKIHQGIEDIRNILRHISSRHILLAHAEKTETEKVAVFLEKAGYSGVVNQIDLDFNTEEYETISQRRPY